MNIAFPSNAFLVIDKISMVASFDIPNVSLGKIPRFFPLIENTEELLGGEDQANLRSSFNLLGYDSANMSDTLGSLYIIILLTGLGLLLTLILLPFKRIACCKKVNGKLKKFLHWNFVIRLIIEGSMDLTFTAYFNLKYANFSVRYYGSFVNYILAIMFGILLISTPIFIIVFYGINFRKLHDKKFEKRYGAAYEGLRLKSRSALVYNSYFVMSRCLFMCIALFLYKRVLF